MLGGAVLYDEVEQLFKMWYLSVGKCFPDFATHYAGSRDGVHWEKPLVGTVKCASHARHNVVLESFDVVSVMLDRADPGHHPGRHPRPRRTPAQRRCHL